MFTDTGRFENFPLNEDASDVNEGVSDTANMPRATSLPQYPHHPLVTFNRTLSDHVRTQDNRESFQFSPTGNELVPYSNQPTTVESTAIDLFSSTPRDLFSHAYVQPFGQLRCSFCKEECRDQDDVLSHLQRHTRQVSREADQLEQLWLSSESQPFLQLFTEQTDGSGRNTARNGIFLESNRPDYHYERDHFSQSLTPSYQLQLVTPRDSAVRSRDRLYKRIVCVHISALSKSSEIRVRNAGNSGSVTIPEGSLLFTPYVCTEPARDDRENLAPSSSQLFQRTNYDSGKNTARNGFFLENNQPDYHYGRDHFSQSLASPYQQEPVTPRDSAGSPLPSHETVDDEIVIEDHNMTCSSTRALQPTPSVSSSLLDHFYRNDNASEPGSQPPHFGVEMLDPNNSPENPEASPPDTTADPQAVNLVETEEASSPLARRSVAPNFCQSTRELSVNNETVPRTSCAKTSAPTHNTRHSAKNNRRRRRSSPCPLCDKTLSSKASFERHLNLLHVGHRPLRCAYCDKSFALKQPLKEHVHIHTGERPYECPICSNTFQHRSVLLRHMRTHTNGASSYGCDFCPSRFRTKGGLERHVLVHTNGKLFECTECGKCWSTSYRLSRHLRTHEQRPSHQASPQGEAERALGTASG